MGKACIIFTIIIFSALQLWGQTLSYSDEVTTVSVEGIEKIARTMISSSFTPLTAYEKDDLLISGAVGLFSVDQIYNDPQVTGEDLYGLSLGGGAGYALSDEIMAYGIFSAILIDGKAQGNFFGGSLPETETTISFQNYSLFGGLGYEVISTKSFSLPVFLGLNGGYYNFRFSPDDVTDTGVTLEGETTGSGFVPGLSGGLAATYRVSKFSFRGYYIYMMNFYGLEGETTLKESVSSLSYTYSHSLDAYNGGTYGGSIKFSIKKGWSFGIKLTNFLPLPFEEETDMKSIIVTMGFN